ncbi:MAG: PEP-CTERM sorting domain-containing protein, partial [Phycisphaerae bacterium]|nr:PEP-CTERM sorting domain-containing protein [Phycisphaerae bacterium]
QSGDFNAVALASYAQNNNYAGGAVTLTGGGPAANSSLAITSTNPAAYAEAINTTGGVPGIVTIRDYKGVTIGAGGINAQKMYRAGGAFATINITNIGVDGISAPGATFRTDFASSIDLATAPDITLSTAGLVNVGNLYTYGRSTGEWLYNRSGAVNVSGGGNVAVTGLIDSGSAGASAGYTASAGAVNVTSTGGAVSLANIVANTTGTNRYGGALTVTAHTKLGITGSIDLSAPSGVGYRGALALTVDAGPISLASLDLGKVSIAKLDGAASGSNTVDDFATIKGVLTGFAGGNTALRTPVGEKVFYYASQNAGLNGDVYQLKNLDNSGNGGYLVPQLATATADESGNPAVFGTPVTVKVPAGATAAGYTGLKSIMDADGLWNIAKLVYGANSSGSDTTVSMAWRTRAANEQDTLFSNVVRVSGMANDGSGSGLTDKFVLQMTYEDWLLELPPRPAGYEASLAAAGNLFLGWRDGSGAWVNATAGNVNNVASPDQNVQGPWNLTYTDVGDWGVDTTTNVVWAVLDHNSDFAIATVPEPVTLAFLALGGLSMAGVTLRRRRQAD